MKLTVQQLKRFKMDPVWDVITKQLHWMRQKVLESAVDNVEEDRLMALDFSRGVKHTIEDIIAWPDVELAKLGANEDKTTEDHGDDETPPNTFSEGE